MANEVTADVKKRLDEMSVGFIGAGRMAQALCKGFINTGLIKASSVIASDLDPNMLKYIGDLGVKTTKNNKEVVQNSDLIVIAVKPHIVTPILKEVSHLVSQRNLFVSIAAGVTLDTIENYLPSKTRVIRVMPNTPALIQTGASVFAPGKAALDNDSEVVATLLSSIGICAETSEQMMDAVTGLSGSGPAYGYMAIEAMADGGVKMGLPRDLAVKLAAQTLMGAAKMVLETGKHPGQLKDEVCSPGGTTIAGVHSLEKSGYRASLIAAVEAATERSKELGRKEEGNSLRQQNKM